MKLATRKCSRRRRRKAYIKVEDFAQSEWWFLPCRVAPGAFAVVASVGLSWRVERRAGDLPMIFEDRADAGRRLAKRLENFAHRTDVIVLGVPRGGVVVAFEVAQSLGAPLDVFLSRKLGVPGQTELAFGAVSASGGRYLDEYILRTTGITSPAGRVDHRGSAEGAGSASHRLSRRPPAADMFGQNRHPCRRRRGHGSQCLCGNPGAAADAAGAAGAGRPGSAGVALGNGCGPLSMRSFACSCQSRLRRWESSTATLRR